MAAPRDRVAMEQRARLPADRSPSYVSRYKYISCAYIRMGKVASLPLEGVGHWSR